MHLDEEDRLESFEQTPATSRARRPRERQPASRRVLPPPRRAGPSPHAAMRRRARSRSALRKQSPHFLVQMQERPVEERIPFRHPRRRSARGQVRDDLGRDPGIRRADRPDDPCSSAASSAATLPDRFRSVPGCGPRSCRRRRMPDGRCARSRAAAGPPSRSSAPDRRARARCRRTSPSHAPR